MKKKKIIGIILMVFLLVSLKIQAQPGFDDSVEDTPIDGGICLLLLFGSVLGSQKSVQWVQKRNSKKIG